MNKKKIYVTGHRGMIGSRLIEKGCSPLVCDITDLVQLDYQIQNARPELIMHMAAKSKVDFCETRDNFEVCYDTNVTGSRNVFSIADKYGIPVVFISSDHIFDGRWFGKYREGLEWVNPRNQYGTMKLMTEAIALPCDNVKIIRTSVLFHKTRDIVANYLNDIENGKVVDPPMFICRSFMHTSHFVESLLQYADTFDGMPKVLNISGSRNVSWYTFIKAYARELGLDSSLVHPRFTDRRLPIDAARPSRAGLNTGLSAKLGFRQYDYLDGVKLK